MRYVLPDFNVTVNVWNWGNQYTNPPDHIFQVSFSVAHRTSWLSYDYNGVPAFEGIINWMLSPSGFRIRSQLGTAGHPDLYEVPAGSSRIYVPMDAAVVALGHANEHVATTMYKLTADMIAGMGVDPSFPQYPPFVV